MEKFTVDLDAVLDEFEFHEEQVRDLRKKQCYETPIFYSIIIQLLPFFNIRLLFKIFKIYLWIYSLSERNPVVTVIVNTEIQIRTTFFHSYKRLAFIFLYVLCVMINNFLTRSY